MNEPLLQTDCPGAGICAINQTWSGRPGGWCMCNTLVGLYGNDCRELCSQGIVVVTMAVIVTVFGFTTSCSGAYFGYRNLRRNSHHNISQAVLFTWLFSMIGLFFFGVSGVIALLNTVGFQRIWEITEVSGRIIRRVPMSLDAIGFILFGVAACFGTCSLFVLCLAWVSLAEASHQPFN